MGLSRRETPVAEGKKKGWRKPGEHHLSAADRNHLPSKDFALPGKGEGRYGKGSGSYPIENRAHAIAALSRASANASPSEQATIRHRVHEKFPGLGSDRADKRYGRKD
jgi:hypothetical protein